jgi:multidrug resistance efflux pump
LKDDDTPIVSANSTVEQAKLNLAHCTITSPIDGVVVDATSTKDRPRRRVRAATVSHRHGPARPARDGEHRRG